MVKITSPKKTPRPEKDVVVRRPHIGLTKTQEKYAELASDIILNGGAREAVDCFLSALLQHGYHRQVMGHVTDDRSFDEQQLEASKWAARFVDREYRELAADWPRLVEGVKKPTPETEAGKSAAAVTRADIRRRLRDEFDTFMDKMEGIENAYVLKEILENVNSCGGDIATEFSQFVTDGGDIYVRVPWGLKGRIQQVIKLLSRAA